MESGESGGWEFSSGKTEEIVLMLREVDKIPTEVGCRMF
jgi:hypothetical protein